MLEFLQKQKTEKEIFWALLIEPEWVNSAVWEVENEKVKVLSKSPSTRWEADLLEAIDVSLSTCMQNLPEDTPDPTKTVFGVPSSWIVDGNIKEEHLLNLKKICDNLSLVPSGFVVLSEAISHYIKYEEEAALTGIVIGVSDQNLELSIFNLGALVGVTNISRSISVEDDITEGLARLSSATENFPARIILFNQKEQELEEILETLNDCNWEKIGSSKFMHTPRIEIFDPAKKIMAVSLAGGSEIASVKGLIQDSSSHIEVEETSVVDLPIEEVNNFEEPDGVTAEDLGFVQEVQKEETFEISEKPIVKHNPLNLTVPQLPRLNFKKPNIKLPKINLSFNTGKPLVIGGSAIATFIVVGFLMWWLLPKADVTIYVSPKKLEESIPLEVNSESDENKIEIQVNGEKTKATSGTKTVGDKAKGQVKIQNGTAFPINLPSGSVLVSSSDLKFVTTSSASISGALSPSSPGTTTLDVEAGSIGSEFNLNKDEVFKVANYPKAEVDATSVNAFSGGSSRQISSVSEDDRKSLLKDLTSDLIKEAKGKLNEKVDSSMYLIEASINTDVDDETFSNKVGDEATSLKLSLTLNVTANSVSKSELTNKAREILNDKVPSGFVLRDDQLSYDFSSDDDGFTVKVTANLLPNIDTTEIAKKIAGKYPNMAEDYLGSVPGFLRAEFKFRTLLPGKLGTLPHLPKNISVMVSADK